MQPPENSKITVTREGEQVTFSLAPSRPIKRILFWLVMSLLWPFALAGFYNGGAPVVFLFPIGLMTIISPLTFLFFLYGQREITVDPERFTFRWSLFGRGRTKTRSWKHLKEVRKVSMFKEKHRHIYGIGLYFKNARRIRFGASLSEADRNYLITTLSKLKK